MDSTLNSFVKEATENIIEATVGWKIEGSVPIERSIDILENNKTSGINVIINFIGTIKGAIILTCSNNMARNITSLMLGNEQNLSEEDIKDALGELLNMIAGMAKTKYSEKLGNITISVPTTIIGNDYNLYIKHDSSDRLSLIEFEYGDELLVIKIYLEKNSI